jgi:sarcosine oxidase
MAAFDVIIVGLGGMGSAAAAHAASRGARVLGIEQYQPGHPRGSSHGRSRVIRLAYFEDPAYVPLLRRAYELWRKLETDTGRRLLQITGGLMIGAPESEVVTGTLQSAREHGLAHEVLDAAGIHRRFPPFEPGEGTVAVHEPEAGVVFPEDAIRAHLDVATRHGARLLFDERVDEWRVTPGGAVQVATARGRHDAGRLILAPGPWARDLFRVEKLPLEVEPQILYWFDPAGGAAPFQPGRFPVYIWDLGEGVQFYGFPADDAGLVKVAFYRSPHTDEDTMRTVLRNHIPALGSGRLTEQVTCRYTLTPDHHFIIGRHPEHPQVVIASPCSGHGYKFASVIGEILADLTLDGRTRHLIGLFAPDRFS